MFLPKPFRNGFGELTLPAFHGGQAALDTGNSFQPFHGIKQLLV